MNQIVKNDILKVLKSLLEIVREKEEKDALEIRQLSNHVIHNASIFQDEDSVSIAVFIYALSKVIERKQGKLNYKKLLVLLEKCKYHLEKDEHEKFRKCLNQILNFIRTLDKKIKLYINEVINQSQIKKGCKLCEHGLSIAKASEVLGVSQWELMGYLGMTTLIDKISEPVHVSSRIKLARRLFK